MIKVCLRGHPQTTGNVYINPNNGARTCRKCRCINVAKWNRLNPEKYNARKRRYAKAGYSRRKSALYESKHPEAKSAHRAIQRALRKGTLVRPDRCSQCGLTCKPEAHHPDYSKWLEVIWLCRPCHLAERGQTPRVVLPTDRGCAA